MEQQQVEQSDVHQASPAAANTVKTPTAPVKKRGRKPKTKAVLPLEYDDDDHTEVVVKLRKPRKKARNDSAVSGQAEAPAGTEKPKRKQKALSSWQLFVQTHRKQGVDFKECSRLYKEQKENVAAK